MTRTLLSLAPLAAVCTLITVRVLTVARRRRREDQAAAARFEQQAAQALAACRDDDGFWWFAEQQFGALPKTPGRHEPGPNYYQHPGWPP
jgi:hypothetical protein